jgi:iron complex transport system substrate-binding protein
MLLLFLLSGSLMAAPKGSPPTRVISLSPNLTQILYDIGAQDLLVGVTDYCKFPPETRSKEKIGGWMNPRFEKIVSLKPDLVLSLEFYGKNGETFKTLRVPVEVLKCDTIEEVLGAYDVIGRRLGREKGARRARQRLEKRLEAVKKKVAGKKPLSVLFVIGHTPGTLDQLYAVGPGNFLHELMGWSGGVNILADSKIPYPIVSKETLLKRDPDVIIDSLPQTEVKPDWYERSAAVWKKMPALRAVQQGHVYCFNNEEYTIPGPTMLDLAEYLSGIFEKVRRSEKR